MRDKIEMILIILGLVLLTILPIIALLGLWTDLDSTYLFKLFMTDIILLIVTMVTIRVVND